MKPVFFIDYDNTIFSHQTWSIPESAVTALEQLQKDGYKVVLASGRAFRSSDLPPEFEGRFTPDCLVSSNGALIEIEGELVWEKYFDPDLQKRILEHYHTTLENCVAIGDSMNDVELIEAAGFGVAMGNAMPEVQAMADYVTADIDHDGLAQAIRKAREHFAN